MEPAHQFVMLLRRADRVDLHATVVEVRGVPADSDLDSMLLHKPAKAHALDTPGDVIAARLQGVLFAHVDIVRA